MRNKRYLLAVILSGLRFKYLRANTIEEVRFYRDQAERNGAKYVVIHRVKFTDDGSDEIISDGHVIGGSRSKRGEK